MNLLQIVQRIARETDEPSITTVEGTIKDNVKRLVDWVNEGYRNVWLDLFDRNETALVEGTISTTQGVDSVNLPSGIYTIETLQYSFYPSMPILLPNEFNAKYYDNSIQGLPEIATVYGGKIKFYPCPDAAYTFSYTALAIITDLTTNSATPVFAAQYHDIFVNYGKYKQYQYDKDNSMQLAYADYEKGKNNLLKTIGQHNNLPGVIMPESVLFRDKRNYYARITG